MVSVPATVMRTDLSVWYQSVIVCIFIGNVVQSNCRACFFTVDPRFCIRELIVLIIRTAEFPANINFITGTNEYADYDRNADEIARYDKKRRGQELTFSRKTKNEYVSNYLTLKNRDDIYKGAVDGYSTQYYEDSWNKEIGRYDSKYDGPDGEYRRKKNFGLTRSIGIARVYDSRDNIYDPHEGKRNSYTIEYAGLGGDFDFTKYSVDYRYYYRLF